MTPPALDSELSSRAQHLPAAVLVVVVTAVLTVLPAQGEFGRLLAVGLLQLALVGAWVVATGLRGFGGSVALGTAAAAGADAAMLLPDRPELDGLLAVLGLGFVAAVVHQMTRPAPRVYLVASLAGVVLLLCSVCALAVLLGVGRLDDGEQALGTAVLAVGAALLVGHLVDLVLPRPQIAAGVPRGLLGLVAAVLAAAAVTWFRRRPEDLFDTLGAAIYGGVVGAVAVLVSLAASYIVVQADRSARDPRRRDRWALPLIQALLPVAACAPLALALAYQTTL